jgi:hypothetical protein
MGRARDYHEALLESRRLYIRHLAQALQAKETGRITLCPTAYRLCARRLRVATAGYPESDLAHTLGITHSAVSDALEDHFFEVTGCLPGAGSRRVKLAADRLISSLRLRRG